MPVKKCKQTLRITTYAKLFSYLCVPFILHWEHSPPPPSLLGRNVMLANSRFKSVKEDSQFTVFSTLLGVDLFSLMFSLILLPELVLPQLSAAFPAMETDTCHILSGTEF